jgi:hypothetical protein
LRALPFGRAREPYSRYDRVTDLSSPGAPHALELQLIALRCFLVTCSVRHGLRLVTVI